MACRAVAREASEGWWARQDSNLQPDGYEPPALTNLATGPTKSRQRGSDIRIPRNRVAPAGVVEARSLDDGTARLVFRCGSRPARPGLPAGIRVHRGGAGADRARPRPAADAVPVRRLRG